MGALQQVGRDPPRAARRSSESRGKADPRGSLVSDLRQDRGRARGAAEGRVRAPPSRGPGNRGPGAAPEGRRGGFRPGKRPPPPERVPDGGSSLAGYPLLGPGGKASELVPGGVWRRLILGWILTHFPYTLPYADRNRLNVPTYERLIDAS